MSITVQKKSEPEDNFLNQPNSDFLFFPAFFFLMLRIFLYKSYFEIEWKAVSVAI